MKKKLKEQLERGLISQEAYDKALAELEEAEAYGEQVEESSEIQLKVGAGIDKPTDGSKVFRARAELKRVNKDLGSTKADIEKAKLNLNKKKRTLTQHSHLVSQHLHLPNLTHSKPFATH